MGVWFNEQNGDIQYTSSSKQALKLKSLGYFRIGTSNRAKILNYYSLKTKKGKYWFYLLYKGSKLNDLINNFTYFEDWCGFVRVMGILREVAYRWEDRIKAYEDRRYLKIKIIEHIKRGNLNIKPELLELLPQDLRKEVIEILIKYKVIHEL